nr:deleted in malignant brain tumors 1 protein-like [Pocillopora verrucosa]
MSAPLILWCVIALFANVPTAFSRPRHIGKPVSEVKADEVQKRQSECGNVTNNELKSPRYPSNYPNSIDCVYWVVIPAGKTMNIYFNDFHLEYHSICSYDYLKIANEKDETFGGRNGKYCGLQYGNVSVTGQYAVLTFHSDSIFSRRGYNLTFTFAPVGSNGTQSPPTYPPIGTQGPQTVYPTNPPWYTTAPPNGTQGPQTVYPTNPPWYTTAPPNVGCGYVQGYQLTSPGYPNNYPNGIDCEYWVYIPYGKALRIYFNEFQVEFHSSCSYDYLRIANEKNETFGGRNGKYCGVQYGSVSVTGQYAVLTFHSDNIVALRGYYLTFTLIPAGLGTQGPQTVYPTNPPWYTTAPPNVGCGYVQGYQLTSPGYPNNYPNGIDCEYWVYIPYGKALRIYFNDFQVESDPSCSYDYLRIANEKNETFGGRNGKYCGVQYGSVSVTGQYAVLTFHSDGSVSRRGYNLTFTLIPTGSNGTQPPPTYPTKRTPATMFPSVGPSPDAKRELQYLIAIVRYLLNQMEYVVNNEVFSVSVRDYEARVKRAITDVHHALRAEGRQKRDVSSVEMISQLEKKADDLIKQLQIKEDRYQRSAPKRKVAIEDAEKAH